MIIHKLSPNLPCSFPSLGIVAVKLIFLYLGEWPILNKNIFGPRGSSFTRLMADFFHLMRCTVIHTERRWIKAARLCISSGHCYSSSLIISLLFDHFIILFLVLNKNRLFRTLVFHVWSSLAFTGHVGMYFIILKNPRMWPTRYRCACVELANPNISSKPCR